MRKQPIFQPGRPNEARGVIGVDGHGKPGLANASQWSTACHVGNIVSAESLTAQDAKHLFCGCH